MQQRQRPPFRGSRRDFEAMRHYLIEHVDRPRFDWLANGWKLNVKGWVRSGTSQVELLAEAVEWFERRVEITI